MLSAYFDDSGTHLDAPVVVMAGFVAEKAAWMELEPRWKAILEREGVNRFHASKLAATDDEFRGWNQARRDAFTHDLREVILTSRIHGIGISVSGRDWDALVTGWERRFMGEAEEFCARLCVHDALKVALNQYAGQKMVVVFDRGMARWQAIKSATDFFLHRPKNDPTIVGIDDGDSTELVPLQAADMLAWETYTFARDWIATNGKPTARPHFQRMLERADLIGGFANHAAIQRMIANEDLAKLNVLERRLRFLQSQT